MHPPSSLPGSTSESGPGAAPSSRGAVPAPSAAAVRAAATRERLFLVALERVREEGFEAVSVSEITRGAGVAKGTFFNHFPTKDHLLAEFLRGIVDRLVEEVSARELAGPEAILHLVEGLAESLSRDPIVTRALGSRLDSLPPLREGEPWEVERIRLWFRARLGEALCIRVPLVEASPEALSFHLVWAVQGEIGHWARAGLEARALRASLRERVSFLLQSAGLPVQPS